MSVFGDINLSWDGRDYVIPATKVMKTIAAIEDVVTLHELVQFGERGIAPLAKLSMAYAVALRMAGLRITDDEVYAGMFSDSGMENVVADSIAGLLAMMVPPSAMAKTEGDSKVPLDGAQSSKKPTRRSSARAG